MTTEQFMRRMERIREKDRNYEVYPKLMQMEITEAVNLIEHVDEQLANQEFDQIINETKEYLKTLSR